MATADQWLLPDGIEELYPEQAAAIEALQRRLLDLYQSWGYELVQPPLLEYLESLNTGMGNDFKLQTLKVTDQLSGRQMGLRADITPQVARIDAHGLKRKGPTRLCYAGPVLHAKPNLSGSRALIQVGVELFGHANADSDAEVIELMLHTLQAAGCASITLDLGHVGICQSLLENSDLPEEQVSDLFDIYQRKAAVELGTFLESHIHDQELNTILRSLPKLAGDSSCLSEARKLLKAYPNAIKAVNALEEIAQQTKAAFPGINIYYDLSELRGYRYHTGVVFAAYIPSHGQAIAKGGRYDDVGEKFGRARPATGFSTDIKTLVNLTQYQATPLNKIFAPSNTDPLLRDTINSLRNNGEVVIKSLQGQKEGAKECGCSSQLINRNGQWVQEDLE
ncbi:MAG: ATP phosphoribosyltransferase regulatory subunit [Pseudomonadales bacterium]|nr:ATP phosphoribosyltransferase regulatory subunit [Pseudomonadales bacterium]